MPLTPSIKHQIDVLTYHQLLTLHRFAPINSPWFKGTTGKYFAARMRHLYEQPGGQTMHTKIATLINKGLI